MNRLLQSLLGGVVITCLLVLSLLVLTLAPSGVQEAFAYLLRWPTLFLRPLFLPEYSDDSSTRLPHAVLAMVALGCDLMLYSALTYVVLRWRDKRLRFS